MKRNFALILLALALLLCVGLMPLRAQADGDRYLEINSTNFPDPVFRDWVKEKLAYGKNYMTKEEVNDATWIDVSEMGIKSLQGIELFPALEILYCENNLLTTLE